MIKRILLSVIMFFLLTSIEAEAQHFTVTDTATYVFTLKNGNKIVGKFLRQSSSELVILSPDIGEISFPWDDLLKFELKGEKYRNVLRNEFYNVNSGMLLANSAIPMNKNLAYAGTCYGTAYGMRVGLTPHASLGIATTFAGTPVAVTPKLSYTLNGKWHAGGGLSGIWINSAGFLGESVEFERVLHPHAIITYGSNASNISAQLGYALVTGGTGNLSSYSLGFSAINTFGGVIILKAEYWLLPQTNFRMGGPGFGIIKKGVNFFDFNLWFLNYGQNITSIPLPLIAYKRLINY